MIKQNLLSSNARIQAPWVKVTIGDYSFGVYDRKNATKTKAGFYQAINVRYPNYIQDLTVVKINGKVNQYSLSIAYPIRPGDDPNFFEKVFSSVSDTHKIIFSYGDSAVPTFAYKDEEAIITKIAQSFNLEASVITYKINAVSSATLANTGSYNFPSDNNLHKPSTLIKQLFKNPNYHLQEIFTGMSISNLEKFIDGDDAEVKLESKIHITVLDYISYLVSCMVPAGTTTKSNISNDIYIMTIHDEISYDQTFGGEDILGPYFKVTRTSYRSEQNDAFEIDVGYNTSTIVTNFNISNDENYSIYYNYQSKIHPQDYVSRLNMDGEWENKYAPVNTSDGKFETESDDITWWTKITKYPINASITIQGLLRPALLMSHIRLNVIFPGGRKHIASGLYVITKQVDTVNSSGYKTQLNLTKISGD